MSLQPAIVVVGEAGQKPLERASGVLPIRTAPNNRLISSNDFAAAVEPIRRRFGTNRRSGGRDILTVNVPKACGGTLLACFDDKIDGKPIESRRLDRHHLVVAGLKSELN